MPKTVAVQTSPNRFSSPSKFCRSLVRDIRPEHFTVVQTSKLEDAFRQRTKPDTVTMQVLAMESNLLFRDVEVRKLNSYMKHLHMIHMIVPTINGVLW